MAIVPVDTAKDEEAALWRSTRSFVAWFDEHGVESHDPYDLWGTRYGLFARRVYYRKHVFGTPLVAPLVAAEVLAPSLARRLVKKQRFATAEAQLALAFLNLYRLTLDNSYLARASALVKGLLDLSIAGYSGHCWGYPFDWQNQQALWRRNTPFITATPYCFEAFASLADATGDHELSGVAASIATFVANDLKDRHTTPEASAGSYSPIDTSMVINASAYRAFVLFESWRRFRKEQHRVIAQRNLQFVLDSQRSDGSWLYALDSPGEAFIDHFHTCFVLKNLAKLNRIVNSSRVRAAVEQGFEFYKSTLFHRADTPKSFAIEPRLQLARVETYNFAEAITLGTLLRDVIPEAFDMARSLTGSLIGSYQLLDGHFVTRTYVGGLRHKVPFLRWPQAQLFLALTNMLLVLKSAPESDFRNQSEPALQVR